MKVDVSLSPLENLVLLAVEVNPTETLTADQVTVSAPTAGTFGEHNSEVVFTAVVGEGKSGSFTFHYTRLALDKGVASAPTSIRVVEADDQDASFAKAVAALGLRASEVTASAFTPPVDSDTAGTITITANADSALYVGEPLVLELTFAAETLDQEFTVTDANGFEPA